MSGEIPFHKTRMGQQFYEITMPKIARGIESIVENMEKKEAKSESPAPERDVQGETRETLQRGAQILGTRRGMERAAAIVREYSHPSVSGSALRAVLDDLADMLGELALKYGRGRR